MEQITVNHILDWHLLVQIHSVMLCSSVLKPQQQLPTRRCSTLLAGPPPSFPFAQLVTALSSWGGLTNRSESYWETLGDQVSLASSSNEYSSLSCHFPLRAKPHFQPRTLSSNWDFTVSTDGVYSTFFIPYGSTRALHKIGTPVGLPEKQKHSFTARNRP